MLTLASKLSTCNDVGMHNMHGEARVYNEGPYLQLGTQDSL